MRTDQLRAVEAAHRLGSFQRAAAELGLTQPAVGDAVRRLELELGTQLFERDAKGAHLTKAGEIALRYVRTFLKTEHALHLELDVESSRKAASLCIGTVASHLSAAVLPAIIKCRQKIPHFAAQVYQGGAVDIRNMLLLGQLDIAIFCKFRCDPTEDHISVLGNLQSSRLIALAPEADPLARQPSIAVHTFLARPLVMLPPGYMRSHAIHRMAEGRDIDIACMASDSQSATAMIANGLGWSVTAELSARNNFHRHAESIVQVPFSDYPMIIDFIVGAHPSVAGTSICRLFADEVANIPMAPPLKAGHPAVHDSLRLHLSAVSR